MFESFLNKVAASRFSKEEEMELLKKYQQTGDERALKKLKISYRPVVQYVVSKSKPRNDDQMSVAQLAVRADGELPGIFKKYDPSKGALNTWVTGQLSFLMSNAVKENLLGPHVPRPEQDGLFVYRQGLEQAKIEFGKNPTPKQILKFAPGLQSVEEIDRIKQYNRRVVIGDNKQEMDDGGFVNFKDQFTTGGIDNNDRYHSLRMDQIKSLMNELDEQERRIINEYVFKNKSMMDVSLSLGLSSSQVRKTVQNWKAKLAEKGIGNL